MPADPKPGRRVSTVQSVERAIASLVVFFEEGVPLGVTEVSLRTGLAPTTVHRLLSTFVKAGWLIQDKRQSRYELSELMLANAAVALEGSPLVRQGYAFLRRISDETGFSSFLAVLTRGGPVLLERVQGKQGGASDFQVGRRLPLNASASGKLFLAYLPDAARQAALDAAGELRRFTPNTVTDRELLLEELASVREHGYAVDQRELYEFYCSVAVPVRKADGRVMAALCCGAQTPDVADDFVERLLAALLPAAAEFSREYGLFDPW